MSQTSDKYACLELPVSCLFALLSARLHRARWGLFLLRFQLVPGMRLAL